MQDFFVAVLMIAVGLASIGRSHYAPACAPIAIAGVIELVSCR